MKFKNIFFAFTVCLVFSVVGFSQSPTQIKKKCPNVSIYSIVAITNLGDINVQPCTNRTTIFTQNVSLPSGTTTGGLTGNPNLAFKATAYTFNNLTNDSEFAIGFTPSTLAGMLTIGDCTATPTLCFSQNMSTGASSLSAGTGSTFAQTATTATLTTSGAQIFRGQTYTFSNNAGTAEFNATLLPSNSNGAFSAGDCITTPTTCFTVSQASNTTSIMTSNLTLGDNTSTGVVDATAVRTYNLQRTVTAGGTTGAQTINKPAGTLNIAAGQASVVLTNSTVTTSSIPFVVLRTADGTCTFVKSAVPTANTLTITLNANCTAETSVGFLITN